MKNNKYWFSIEPYIHTNMVPSNEILMYNPLNNKHYEFYDQEIFSLVQETLSTLNSGVKELKQSEVEKYKHFIDRTRDDFMTDLIPVANNGKEPIRFNGNPMILTETGGPSEEKFGKNVLYNLTQLTIFLNGDCDSSCSLCQKYYKQTICCQTISDSQIGLSLIVQLLIESKESSLLKLNLVGGNILKFREIRKLIEELNQYEFEKNYLFNVKHLTDDVSLLQQILSTPKNFIEIQIPSIKDLPLITKSSMLKFSNRILFNFFIQSEKDINLVNEYVSIHSIDNIRFTPIFNGKNSAFFEQYIFTDVSDIFEEKHTEKEIKRNYVLNDYFFGHLIVFPNGNIYSNVSDTEIGKFPENSLNQIIHKELVTGNNWLNVRRKVQPCSNCIYNCLCQPISTYELAIGKPNLCHVKP